MNAIADARAQVSDTKQRFLIAAHRIAASPATMAIAAVFAIAFASQLIYARERLPPVGGLSLAQVGLPSLDLGAAGAALQEASAAAQRQGVEGFVMGFLDERRFVITWLNAIGFALAVSLLIWTLLIQARLYRERPS